MNRLGEHYTKSYKFNFSFSTYICMYVCYSSEAMLHKCICAKHGQAKYWLDANMHIRYSTYVYDTHTYVAMTHIR